MAIVRRRSGLVRLKSDRAPLWLGLEVDSATISANTVVLASTLNASALALRPFTIVRTRLEVLWRSDQVAASEVPHGAVGGIVVSEQAVAAGAASVPDPVGDTDSQFFAYQSMIVSFIAGATAVDISPAGQRYTIDSKSMRKVANNEDIAFVVTNSDTAHGALFSVQGRILVKLH